MSATEHKLIGCVVIGCSGAMLRIHEEFLLVIGDLWKGGITSATSDFKMHDIQLWSHHIIDEIGRLN